MSQIVATFTRMLKELVRERVAVFWTIAFPLVWLIMARIVFLSSVGSDVVGSYVAMFSVGMSNYALMTAGMVDLPGKFNDDREKGMLLKLKSMPVKPWMDFAGRLIALLLFSGLAIAIVMLAGILMGAQFSTTGVAFVQSIGYIILVILSTSGVGLIIATVVKRGEGALYTGIGTAIITGFMSGIFTVYNSLPSFLQSFSRIYPISSSNASMIHLLVGENMAGYNPLEPWQIVLTIATSIILFSAGSVLHTKYCWRKE